MPERSNATSARLSFVAALLAAVGLTAVFWPRLWIGGGIVGGDTYSYFYPQKQFFGERLHDGELPLWNNRSGFGYPLVAESQTGVFYPPNLLYGLLDLEAAYNVIQLAHYVLAFLFAWLYAREMGLLPCGAGLAALVFVYGWFAPRLCLEWAILTGCYLPGVLWSIERFLRTARRRWLLLCAVLLAFQMLAGHFHLAFITQVLVCGYTALRLWFSNDGLADRLPGHRRLPAIGWIAAAAALAFSIAAVQLLPTWELKQASQRDLQETRDFDPGYGHIPPLYLSQVVASWWFWYSPEIDRDRALQGLRAGAIPSGTNQVEAHLYFGLIPLGLILFALAGRQYRAWFLIRSNILWFILGGLAVIYATGWLLPIARHLPGFGYFRGPGRFGIVTTFAVACLGGRALDLVIAKHAAAWRRIIAATLIALTIWDLWWTSRVVNYAGLVRRSGLQNLESSPIRQLLADSPQLVRLYAPGPNLTNLLGVSSVPEYLGIGPAEYYSPDTKALPLDALTPKFLDWAERSGITHLLWFEPLSIEVFKDRLQARYAGPDPFLNPAWNRSFDEPLFLYELTASRGRAVAEPDAEVRITHYGANRIQLETQASESTTVVLRDLFYPGWTVSVDSKPADALRVEKLFRGVTVPAGQHTIEWRFAPRSVFWGAIISGIAVSVWLGLCGCAWMAARRCRNGAEAPTKTT